MQNKGFIKDEAWVPLLRDYHLLSKDSSDKERAFRLRMQGVKKTAILVFEEDSRDRQVAILAILHVFFLVDNLCVFFQISSV